MSFSFYDSDDPDGGSIFLDPPKTEVDALANELDVGGVVVNTNVAEQQRSVWGMNNNNIDANGPFGFGVAIPVLNSDTNTTNSTKTMPSYKQEQFSSLFPMDKFRPTSGGGGTTNKRGQSSASNDTNDFYNEFGGTSSSIVEAVPASTATAKPPAPPPPPPATVSSSMSQSSKSCRSQNLQYPDKYYTNQESNGLLAELRGTIDENRLSKSVLKSKIFKLLATMDKNLTLDDAVEFLVDIQGAFNRTDQQQICNDICHDKGVGQIVGMLVFHRHQLKNEQKLKVARSLLRVSWSLTFSTISDLVNALRPSTQTGLYTVDELELFCQCLHNFYLLENVDKSIINCMAETATQFMTGIRPDTNQPDANLETLLYKLTIVYKCYGKRLSQSDKTIVCEAFELFAKRGIMKGDNLFNDNRSCVVHVLDSLYRAESQLPRFSSVIENCVLELATKSVVLTTQDISAVLRVFQRYRDTNSLNFCLALQKVATAMNERIIKGLSGEIKVRAKDFLKNMKILSSKYFIDVHLYENFCALVDRDLKEECKCSKKPCPKSCLMLDFCNLADVLDSISTVHYVFKEKSNHFYFLSRIAERLTEPACVQSFFGSPHRNKSQKLMYILQNFQIYGFYPESFINDDQFDELYRDCNFFRSYFLIKQQEFKFASYERLGIEFGSSKTGDAKIDMFLNYNTQRIETQAKNLIKMEERLREVLNDMNFKTLKQSHSVCNNTVYFIINDETAVLPLARVKFCRDKTGTVDNLSGLSGKITPVYRMLKTQYRYVLQVPYYDFERKIGAEAEYLHEQLAKLHEADGNGNVNSMYHDLAPEEHQYTEYIERPKMSEYEEPTAWYDGGSYPLQDAFFASSVELRPTRNYAYQGYESLDRFGVMKRAFHHPSYQLDPFRGPAPSLPPPQQPQSTAPPPSAPNSQQQQRYGQYSGYQQFQQGGHHHHTQHQHQAPPPTTPHPPPHPHHHPQHHYHYPRQNSHMGYSGYTH